ncbi:kinase-like protein [Backusella circina FSU 941]|nr:kinase-like protein [Backusella circina FSU 941]
MTEKSLSNLHQYKLTRARYRLRSHTRKERERSRVRHEIETKGRSLRNRTIPPTRTSSNEIKLIRRTSKVRKVIKSNASSIIKSKSTTLATKNKKGTTTTAVSKKGTTTTNKKATTGKKTAAVASPTPTLSTSTDENKYVVFDWHQHPNAYACILRPPYALKATPTKSMSTQLAISRKNNINATTKSKSSALMARKPAVNYINRKSSNQTRGGYIIGSDPSSDYVIHGTNITPRHCIIYSQIFTCVGSGKAVLIPILSNLSSQTIYVHKIKNNEVIHVLPKRSTILKREYAIRFTKELKATEPHLIFFNKTFPVPSFEETFLLGDMIGCGNFSSVHKAIDKKTSEIVAVKRIEIRNFKRTLDTLSQFAREVGTMMSLEPHPGIIQTKSVYEDCESYYIVMEYACGGELYTHISSNGYLSESKTRIIFYQLFSTIQFLHDRNIVHRDIKPENILVTSHDNLQVKLCDFGLATLHCTNMRLLTVCGTVVYVAPEILTTDASNGYGKSCDLWSLGVVLYTCLHGCTPFFKSEKEGSYEVDTLDTIKKGQYQFTQVGSTGKTVSEEAKDLISRLLTVNTQDRISIHDALNHPWMKKEREYTRSKIAKIDERYLFTQDDMMDCT